MRAAAPSRPPVAPQGIASPLHRLFALACFAVCHRSIMLQLRRVQLLCLDWYARLAASRVNLCLLHPRVGGRTLLCACAHIRAGHGTSAPIRGPPRASADIRVGPRASADIRVHPRTSAGIRRHPRSSADVRRHPRTSVHLRRHPHPCRRTRAHPHPSAHIRRPCYDLRSMRLSLCASTTLVACSVVPNSCAACLRLCLTCIRGYLWRIAVLGPVCGRRARVYS